MSGYHVRFTDAARDDLLRLHAKLLARDPDLAAYALYVVRDALRLLERFPDTCRSCHLAAHAPPGTRLHELPLPLGGPDGVALFAIEDHTVTVLAVRPEPDDAR